MKLGLPFWRSVAIATLFDLGLATLILWLTGGLMELWSVALLYSAILALRFAIWVRHGILLILNHMFTKRDTQNIILQELRLADVPRHYEQAPDFDSLADQVLRDPEAAEKAKILLARLAGALEGYRATSMPTAATMMLRFDQAVRRHLAWPLPYRLRKKHDSRRED